MAQLHRYANKEPNQYSETDCRRTLVRWSIRDLLDAKTGIKGSTGELRCSRQC
jgi:hypothetical protein